MHMFYFTFKVNGGWSAWLIYGSCSRTCGFGTQWRKRSCNNPPPSSGGTECPGSNTERQNCKVKDCPGN